MERDVIVIGRYEISIALPEAQIKHIRLRNENDMHALTIKGGEC